MEAQALEKTPQSEQDRWFTVGKAYGLQGNKRAIDDFFKALEDAEETLKKKRRQELEALEDQSVSITTRLVKLDDNISKAISKMFSGLSDLLNNYRKMLRGDEAHRGFIQPKAEELYQMGYDRLKAQEQRVISFEKDLTDKISSFEKRMEEIIRETAASHALHMAELSRGQKNYTALWEGFLYGQALKEAQSFSA